MKQVLSFCLSLALLPCTSIALAQDAGGDAASSSDDQRAHDLYLLGNQRYEEGRYVDAIEAFEESYRLSRRPALLFNLANANERMGNLKAAIRHLEDYRPHADPSELQTLDRRLESLHSRLRLETTAATPNAGPQPVETVVPRPADPALPTPLPASDPAGGDSGGAAPAVGYTLVALGGAGLIVGGIFAGLTLSARKDAADGCAEGGLCTAAGADAASREKSLALVADVAFGLGGASLITGVIVLIAHAATDDESPSTSITVAPLPTAGGGMIWASGRF